MFPSKLVRAARLGVLGVCAAFFTLAPASVFAQVTAVTPRPPMGPSQTAVIYKAKPEDKVAIQQFLDALDRGDVVELAFEPRNAFKDAWDKTASAWLNASDADRERRKRILAVAILKAGHDGLKDSTTWQGVRWLIEWECDQIRRGPSTEFEHEWLQASIVVIQGAGDSAFLEPPRMRCERLQPCDHAWHALSRFPEDSRLRFAHTVPSLTAKPFAREPGELLKTPHAGTPMSVAALQKTFEDLASFQQDPVIGPEVRLKIGLLHYALNHREESLKELTVAFTKSRDAYIRYVAAFVTGLIHEADGRANDATVWYEAALIALPNVRSGATWLAGKYFLSGRREDAFTLMDRVYAAPAPDIDPWHQSYEFLRWNEYFERLRGMVKR